MLNGCFPSKALEYTFLAVASVEISNPLKNHDAIRENGTICYFVCLFVTISLAFGFSMQTFELNAIFSFQTSSLWYRRLALRRDTSRDTDHNDPSKKAIIGLFIERWATFFNSSVLKRSDIADLNVISSMLWPF